MRDSRGAERVLKDDFVAGDPRDFVFVEIDMSGFWRIDGEIALRFEYYFEGFWVVVLIWEKNRVKR